MADDSSALCEGRVPRRLRYRARDVPGGRVAGRAQGQGRAGQGRSRGLRGLRPSSPMGGAKAERTTFPNASTRFAFGDNWASYAALVDEERLVEAERYLVRLLGPDGLRGRTMLDIGC